jgi:hypothetical protein
MLGNTLREDNIGCHGAVRGRRFGGQDVVGGRRSAEKGRRTAIYAGARPAEEGRWYGAGITTRVNKLFLRCNCRAFETSVCNVLVISIVRC